jgi:hypothetical protein
MLRLGTRDDPEREQLGEPRYFPIVRFRKYLVFYGPRTDGIEVLRVPHGARDLDAVLIDSGDESNVS